MMYYYEIIKVLVLILPFSASVHKSVDYDNILKKELILDAEISDCIFNKNNSGSFWTENITTSTNIFKSEDTIQYDNNVFRLWKNFPLTILENVTTAAPKCKLAYENFLQKVLQNDFSALKMLDATAKLSSGILRGNVNQYGDFDECLEVKNAQYCLAEVDIKNIWRKPYSEFKSLIHSHFYITETFNDPGHRVPGFTFIRWGFCIPSDCSYKDLENALEEKLGIKSRIRPMMCQTLPKNEETPLSRGALVARYFFLLIISAIIISTFLTSWDVLNKEQNKWWQVLMSFSLQKNYNELTAPQKQNSKEIQAIHGVRGLCAFGLIMSHKVLALFYNPYINRSEMSESLGLSWSVIGRTAILYTDGFMLISGILNAYALFSDLEKNKSMRFKDKVISRLFRILPNLVAVTLFCTYYLPTMGSGPLWPLVVNHHSNLCKKYMWRNMLLIHNYFGFENMCLTHTHQLGIDMQLFLVTPLVVYLIWKVKRVGFWVLGAIGAISTLLRLIVTYQNNLSHVVYFGIPISKMFDTANFSYILPTHRATIYFMGVYLAYVLKFSNPKPIFSKFQQLCLWVLLVSVFLTAWFGPIHMSKIGYKYNKIDAAVYGALSPIFWGAGVCWGIYSTNKGYAGWLGNILEWKYFQKFTKISYAVYLVQFPVFFYNIGLTRFVGEYKPYLMFQAAETSLIFFVSVLLTITIEMPFQNIRKILFNNNNNNKNKTNTNRAESIIINKLD